MILDDHLIPRSTTPDYDKDTDHDSGDRDGGDHDHDTDHDSGDRFLDRDVDPVRDFDWDWDKS